MAGANRGVCSDLIGSIPVHFQLHADSVERVQYAVCLRFCECASASWLVNVAEVIS